MPYVHAIATWTSPSVQKEWDPHLILVQNSVQVSVTKDKSSAEHAVRLVSCNFLESFQQHSVNPLGAKSVYKFVIIDSFWVSVLVNATRDIKGSDALFFRLELLRSFCKCKGCQSRGLSGLIFDFLYRRHGNDSML